ncbi:MAG: MoxR family ATPase [Wenzhouxiangella sp.]|nr:MoxR family ATPase [Wenzhouxiangella sp.]
MTLPAVQHPHLPRCGVYGFDDVEPLIFASLVTEDPLLLIGPSGTGKTYLLNTLSEVLGLEHRHYNASLIAFDDLVGFPFPNQDNQSVEFLQTPATVWGAQSVLIDEISRCKPEHQNRLFALIHERKIQGLSLDRLQYRWAAMNPASGMDQGVEDYVGSEPLDPALADRFSLLIEVKDWQDLDVHAKSGIANPKGEGLVADDQGALLGKLNIWKARFQALVDDAPKEILTYARLVADALIESEVRLSPRRIRLLVRNILAVQVVMDDRWSLDTEQDGQPDAETGRQLQSYDDTLKVLQCSLPHVAWGGAPSAEKIKAAHHLAWVEAMALPERHVLNFQRHTGLNQRIEWLLDESLHADIKSQALIELALRDKSLEAQALLFVITPAVVGNVFDLNAEAVQAVSEVGLKLLDIRNEDDQAGPIRQAELEAFPELKEAVDVLADYDGRFRKQLKQFFLMAVKHEHQIDDPSGWVRALDGALSQLGERYQEVTA